MATKEKKRVTTREKLKSKYIEAVLKGESIASVYSFCHALKMKESTFYKEFSSFKALEEAIWSDWLQDTISGIQNDPGYEAFSIREKTLAFYYTWFETLLTNRSFICATLQENLTPDVVLKAFKSLKNEFKDFVEDLIAEGETSGEIPRRKAIVNRSYSEACWFQFIFLLNFWKNDSSSEFSSTDAAIEKSVNLSLDLFARGPLDSIVDFVKFMYNQSNLR